MASDVTRCHWCALVHRPGPEHCLHGVLLVCGGRDYADWTRLVEALDRVAGRMELSGVRHGDARGADALAGRWALMRQIPVDPMAADWRMGRRAGPLRNAAMLAKTPAPAACVAFTPGPSGTFDMAEQCRVAHVPVWRVGWTAEDHRREVAWLAKRR